MQKCQHHFRYLYEQESQPDLWFRRKHGKLYEESLAAAAEFLGAKTENLALVDNVTTGENTHPFPTWSVVPTVFTRVTLPFLTKYLLQIGLTRTELPLRGLCRM